MSTKSPPTSPNAARCVTSPPPASPTTARAGSVKPATPDKPKAATPAPASPPKPPSPKKTDPPTPEKKAPADTGAKADEPEPDESIPDAVEKLDIDEEVFFQITEMDDEDPECEFSREIVVDYFKQAATTLDELKQALKKKDLHTLSSKGHFLKGSSAALGVKKVQESCEHVQHYGAKRDEIVGIDLTERQALRRIELIMPRLERDFRSAEVWLRDYYSKQGIDLEE